MALFIGFTNWAQLILRVPDSFFVVFIGPSDVDNGYSLQLFLIFSVSGVSKKDLYILCLSHFFGFLKTEDLVKSMLTSTSSPEED